MLKIKKIKLAGFRGILHEKELDCSNGSSQTNSLVLYGPNSTGKTSFVDGIEWFLSPSNQIGWLRREQAKEAAYPHHEADESFVEIEFKQDGTDKTLRKTFDHARKTVPQLTPEGEFENIYGSSVIKPYLRYQEIVEFVFWERHNSCTISLYIIKIVQTSFGGDKTNHLQSFDSPKTTDTLPTLHRHWFFSVRA